MGVVGADWLLRFGLCDCLNFFGLTVLQLFFSIADGLGRGAGVQAPLALPTPRAEDALEHGDGATSLDGVKQSGREGVTGCSSLRGVSLSLPSM